MQHGARARSVTSDLTLVIGNKNYSSWSLRPWLALRNAGIPFTERLLLLFDENWKEAIAAVSPSGRVPVIQHGERTIWETLAILEYAHELYPEVGLWPEDRNALAVARAVANEMHAGFTALRTHMPMNLRRLDLKGKGRGPERRQTTSPESARSGACAGAVTVQVATSCSVPSARPTPCTPRW